LKLDTTKVGVAAAKAMEGIEKFVSNGDIPEEAKVGACVVVVALDHPTPDDAPGREYLYDTASQVFTFSDPDTIYIQRGLLEMAIESKGTTGEDED
jgi:hypothetical protein